MRFAQLVRLHGDVYRHTVVAMNGNYAMGQLLPPGHVTLKSLDYKKGDAVRTFKVFHDTLKAVRPDVLITYNWGAIEWAIVNRLGKRLRHLHIEDGFGPEEATRQLLRRAWTRRFALAGRNTAVVLPSKTLEAIARRTWKLPSKQLNYIPNGVNCARFAVQRSEPANGRVTLGTVATLRREKNIARLINAFSAVKERNPAKTFQLIIVGDGPERLALEDLVAILGISQHVQFIGNSTEPEKWLRKMDLFALSSDTEQMPLGVLEAMASGLPIVSTAVGDVAKMVSDLNAPFVVDAGTPFEQALSSLTDNPKLRTDIGAANANRAVQYFDETVMAARYAKLIG